MEDDIDIEEHDVMDSPALKAAFPDLSIVKQEAAVPDLSLVKEEILDYDAQGHKTQPIIEETAGKPEVCDPDSTTVDFPSIKTEPMDIDDSVTHNVTGNGHSNSPHQSTTFFGNKIILGKKKAIQPQPVPGTTSKISLGSKKPDSSCQDVTAKYIEHGFEKRIFETEVVLDDWGSYLKESECYCSECEILFPTINTLGAHRVEVHSHLVAIAEDEAVHVSVNEGDANIATSTNKDAAYVCHICNVAILHKCNLSRHYLVKHNIKMTGANLVKTFSLSQIIKPGRSKPMVQGQPNNATATKTTVQPVGINRSQLEVSRRRNLISNSTAKKSTSIAFPFKKTPTGEVSPVTMTKAIAKKSTTAASSIKNSQIALSKTPSSLSKATAKKSTTATFPIKNSLIGEISRSPSSLFNACETTNTLSTSLQRNVTTANKTTTKSIAMDEAQIGNISRTRPRSLAGTSDTSQNSQSRLSLPSNSRVATAKIVTSTPISSKSKVSMKSKPKTLNELSTTKTKVLTSATPDGENLCFHCQEHFPSKDLLINHLYQTIYNKAQNRVFQHVKPPFKQQTKQNLIANVEQQPFQVDTSQSKVLASNLYASNAKNQGKKMFHRCPICTNFFSRRFEEHMLKSHNDKATKVTNNAKVPFSTQCGLCPKNKLSTVRLYYDHIRKSHRYVLKETPSIPMPEKILKRPIFPKKPAPKVISTKSVKAKIMRMFKCTLCNAKSTNYGDMRRHRKKFHPEFKNKGIINTTMIYTKINTIADKTSSTAINPVPILGQQAKSKMNNNKKNINRRSANRRDKRTPLSIENLENPPIQRTLFQCFKCKMHFLSHFRAVCHVNNCRDYINRYVAFKCPMCPRTFKRHSKIIHLKQHSIYGNQLKTYEVDPGNKLKRRLLNKCPKCAIHFTDPKFLEHYPSCGERTEATLNCNHCNIEIESSTWKLHAEEHMTCKPLDFVIVEYHLETSKKIDRPAKRRLENSNDEAGPSRKLSKSVPVCDSTIESEVEHSNANKSNKLLASRNQSGPINSHLSFCLHCECYIRNFNKFNVKYHTSKGCLTKIKQEKIEICQICGLTFTRRGILTHVRIHKLHPEMSLFDFKFYKMGTSIRVSPTMHPHQKCAKCNVSFLPEQVHSCDEDFQFCNMCNIHFNIATYKLHMPYHLYGKQNQMSLSNKGDVKTYSKIKRNNNMAQENTVENSNGTSSKTNSIIAVEKNQISLSNINKGHIKTYCKIKQSVSNSNMAVENTESCISAENITRPNSDTNSGFALDKLKEIPKRALTAQAILEMTKTMKAFTLYRCDICGLHLSQKNVEAHMDVKYDCKGLNGLYVSCGICDIPIKGDEYKVHMLLHNDPTFKKSDITIVNLKKGEGIDRGDLEKPNKFVIPKCRKCNICIVKMTSRLIHKCMPNKGFRKECPMCHREFSKSSIKCHMEQHRKHPELLARSVVIPFDPPRQDSDKTDSDLLTDDNTSQDSFAESASNYKRKRVIQTNIDDDEKSDKTKNETLLKLYFEKYEPDTYTLNQCTICHLNYAKKSSITLHICNNRQETRICSLCKLHFDVSEHKVHMLNHEENINYNKVTVKVKPFKPTEGLLYDEDSNKIVAVLYKCVCGLHCMSESDLSTHLQDCGSTNSKKYQTCPKCGRMFKDKVLHNHLSMHDDNKNIEFKVIEKVSEPIDRSVLYKCAKCTTMFFHSDIANEHFKLCNPRRRGLKTWTCLLCCMDFNIPARDVHRKHHQEVINLKVDDFFITTVGDDDIEDTNSDKTSGLTSSKIDENSLASESITSQEVMNTTSDINDTIEEPQDLLKSQTTCDTIELNLGLSKSSISDVNSFASESNQESISQYVTKTSSEINDIKEESHKTLKRNRNTLELSESLSEPSKIDENSLASKSNQEFTSQEVINMTYENNIKEEAHSSSLASCDTLVLSGGLSEPLKMDKNSESSQGCTPQEVMNMSSDTNYIIDESPSTCKSQTTCDKLQLNTSEENNGKEQMDKTKEVVDNDSGSKDYKKTDTSNTWITGSDSGDGFQNILRYEDDDMEVSDEMRLKSFNSSGEELVLEYEMSPDEKQKK